MSELKYHGAKWFWEDLLAIEMKKIKVKINKPVYLYFPILEISKTLMHTFLFNCIKPKYQKNSNTMLYGYWQLYYFY